MSPTAPTVLDAWVFPDHVAADLAQWAPQACLIPVLDELVPAMLSADGRVDALVAVERYIAMLQARSSELLCALDAGDTTKDQFTRDCVAAALRVPPASMKARMASARDLSERLPATLELLRAGEISQRHAADLVELTRSLAPELATVVETAVLARAPRQTTAQFRASVRKAVLRLTDPATEEAAHQDAAAERRVVFHPAADGMTEVFAYLTADSAALIKATLDAMANKTIHLPGGDHRTAHQRRSDALVDLARDALAADRSPASSTPAGPTCPTPADPPSAGPRSAGPAHAERTDTADSYSSPSNNDPASTDATDPYSTDPSCTDVAQAGSIDPASAGPGLVRAHGQRPAIQVTIAASTLMGLDDQSCELDGYGPITAAMARRIAADPTATWKRLLTDDRGHVLHAGTRSYHPTAGMTATVLARDQHCTFPGCRRASRYNDLDHVVAWKEGDDTTAANLAALCRRHHRLKHSDTWSVFRDDPTGIVTWTDPRGRTYLSCPPDLPTTTTDSATNRTTAARARAESATPTTGCDDDPPPF